MKYIDADLLQKKIDKWAEAMADAVGDYSDGVRFMLEHFTFLLDSLQQNQPEVDLEKAADDYVRWDTCDTDDGPSVGMAKDAFKAGAKWAMEQGVKATGTISPRGIIYDNNVGYHLFLERYHNGDKVEVQIRKIEPRRTSDESKSD